MFTADVDVFRDAMSRFAGAVNVIATAGTAHEPRGMTATAVCSVCAEPPSLLVCLHREAGTTTDILRNGVFSVNVLSEMHTEVAQAFADSARFGADRFEIGEWETGHLEVPVLTDALVSFECSVARTLSHGTHSLVIGAIESVRWESASGPLVYHGRKFVGLGRDLTARPA